MKDLKDIKCYLLDMDGTIYLGNELIDGAKEFLEKLKEKNIRYIFLLFLCKLYDKMIANIFQIKLIYLMYLIYFEIITIIISRRTEWWKTILLTESYKF